VRAPLFVAAALGLAAFVPSNPVDPPAAQSEAERLARRVRELAEEFLDAHPLAGLSVAVALGPETVLVDGFGFADLEHMAPASADTLYRIGSLTQQFTAVAILQLVEDGRLSLDDPLSKFFADWPAHAAGVSVRQLLTHTSGIPSYTGFGLQFGDDFCQGLEREDIVALFRDRPLDFEPGTGFSYSASGYYLLGLILEEVSGQGYTDYVIAQLFEPLEMERTVYCYDDALLVGRASGYQEVAGELHNDAPFSMLHPFAAGALCSTAGDLLRWQRGLLDGIPIRRESWELLTAPARLKDGTELPFGLGLCIEHLAGHRAISHGGGINGFRSHLAWYADLDLTIVVLANGEDAPVDHLERAIARAALGLDPEPVRDLLLSAEEKAVYTGGYQIGSTRIDILDRGPRLALCSATEPELELRAQGAHVFVSAGRPDTRVTFLVQDGEAQAWAFLLEQGGFQQLARRLD
jgi:CubicO group peptidase (beta-lactamase class C family)